MGVFAGPKVVSDGLVLSLDPGNIFKSVDSTSNNFLQNGSFAGGLGVTYEQGSNPTNTIIELENPGDSNYVLRQNGNNTEYQMNIDGGAQGTLSASTQYVMSGWYATSDDYNGGDTMFHARAFSTGGSHIATGTGIGTLLYSVEIGGLTWEYRYQTITTPSDYNGNFDWYMGYGTTNTTGYRYYTGLKVEQGSFPSLLDLSRNGNDAKVINGTSYSSINGGAIQTDSTDDYINIGGGLPTGDAWSFNIWFLIDGPTSFTQTGHRTFLSTNNFRFQWDDTNSTSIARGPFIDFNSGAGSGIAQYSTSLSPSDIFNRWHMTSVTSDGSTIKVYYDASTDGVGATEISGSRNFSTNAAATLGYDNRSGIGGADIFNRDGGNTYFSNISIYNRALTASEIQQNFNALRGRFEI